MAESQGGIDRHAIPLADANVVREYVADLRGFLENPGIVERKAFLKSFVEGIEVESSQVTVHYTIPVWPDNQAPASEAVGVLPFVHHGPPFFFFRLVVTHSANSLFSGFVKRLGVNTW